mgnify:CR=1 FL=1
MIKSKRLRFLVGGLFLAATLFFLYRVRGALLPFLAGGILAYFLWPAVKWLEKKGCSRNQTLWICYLGLGILVLPFFSWSSHGFYEN